MEAATKRADWVACLKQACEGERLRISRLLHDEVGQVLSALGLQLELLRMDLSDVPAAAERIAGTQKLLASALEQVRELSYELNPAIVERLGLHASLERLVGRYRRNFNFCSPSMRVLVSGSSRYRWSRGSSTTSSLRSGLEWWL